MIELISVHIPKTGGTTFRDILRKVYGRKGVVGDYRDAVGGPQSLVNTDYSKWFVSQRKVQIDLVKRYSRRRATPTRVVHGHFRLEKYDGEFLNAKRITWVRHPVSRVISVHLYKSIAWDKLLAHPYSCNHVSDMLRGYNLSDLFFVGVLEYFDEDLLQLSDLLGWPVAKDNLLAYTRRKWLRRKHQTFNPSQELLDRIEKVCQPDLELYNEALSLRKERTF